MDKLELPDLPDADDAALALPPDDSGYDLQEHGLPHLPELPKDDGENMSRLPTGGAVPSRGRNRKAKTMARPRQHLRAVAALLPMGSKQH